MQLLKSIDKPIIAVVGFNLLTLAVFMTAPVAWDTDNRPLLCFFVIVCQLLIFLGFQLGRNKGLLTPQRHFLFSSGAQLTPKLFALYACTFFISYAYRTGFAISDFAGIYHLLLEGVLDRRFGYLMALRGTGIGPIPWTVYFIISIFDQIFFIVGFVQWKTLSSFKKLLFVSFVGVELFFTIGRGTAFGVVCMIVTFYLSSMFWTSSTRLLIARATRNSILVFILLVGSVAFFSYNLYNRNNNVERGFALGEFGNSSLISDHPAFSIIPVSLIPSYLNVISYVAGGYFHTSLAFAMDFKSTWLLGNNPALISLASGFGIDVWKDTYIHRLQSKGVDEYQVWHSAYTWYASDVSFYGVPFLLCFLAYLFGFSWAKAGQGDFLSKVVFIILGNMLLFLFANNTYLSTVFYSFIFLLPFWTVTRFFVSAHAVSGLAPSRETLRSQQ